MSPSTNFIWDTIKPCKDIQHLQAIRKFRLGLCVIFVGSIWYSLIYYPIDAMAEIHMKGHEYGLGIEGWMMVITGIITSQILILSMYREIKYGGYKEEGERVIGNWELLIGIDE